jgi:hypothetical protein
MFEALRIISLLIEVGEKREVGENIRCRFHSAAPRAVARSRISLLPAARSCSRRREGGLCLTFLFYVWKIDDEGQTR